MTACQQAFSHRRTCQQVLHLDVAGNRVPVRIHASDRKSIRLSVNEQGEINLRVPLECDPNTISRFLSGHQAWLAERCEHVERRRVRAREQFQHLGQDYPIEITRDVKKVCLLNGRLRVPYHSDDEQIQKSIEAWRRRFAKEDLQQRIDRWWPAFQQYSDKKPVLRVKRMRTRWGSLSTLGYINLNLALTQLPDDLIELIVVHELCHLRHMNHGKGFQQLMGRHLPDWRLRAKRLDAASVLL